MKVEYRSNNSGGDWWLTDENWKALEAAGWTVDWIANDSRYGGDRWLGALAKLASVTGVSSLREAVSQWEAVTGQCSTDAGCPCCGQPHNFKLYDDEGRCVDSGPHISYSASW